MVLFRSILECLTILILFQGCGTIVGNGNKCFEDSCRDPAERNPQKSPSLEPADGRNNDSPQQESATDADKYVPSKEDSPTSGRDSSGNSPGSNSGANNRIDWRAFASAIFDPCSALFDLNLQSTLKFSGAQPFLGGRLELILNSQQKSGNFTFTASKVESGAYVYDQTKGCSGGSVKSTENGGIIFQKNNWTQLNASEVEMIVEYSFVNSIAKVRTISVKINGSTLVLMNE